ncbi:MAG TPA: S8 family serine peptidase [Caldisericia bacterium]|nr:S8 family serine peptidase [Caldisericia bacterium]HPF49587.1 S8 family serine peptidase [Caldisericia bacterium]HPI84497.1 S8 family serine peptidase [Caldisericia bacterium]HPQ93863.1 S8 family serine peptidase [Caldisericia bacterium]HRV75408.1 S8 family serine peptidase [Caldisericia bacterium]
MKKILTISISIMLIVTMFSVVPSFALANSDRTVESYKAPIAKNLLSAVSEMDSSATIEAIVWTNSPIDSHIDEMMKVGKVISQTHFPKLGCYMLVLTASGLDEVAGIRSVERVQENVTMTVPDFISEDDEDEERNWGLDDLNAQSLWDKGYRGQGVTIGLLDSGIDGEHPDLSDCIEKFAAFTMTGEKEEDDTPFDIYGHGTHCAGILTGKKTGIAPDVKLYVGSVIPTGSGTFAQVLAGMEWVLDPDDNPDTDDAPQIVTMSLGGAADEDMNKIADVFQRRGVLLVSSIGNDGQGSSGSPGNIPSVIGVGSYTKDRIVSVFSGGEEIDWSVDPYHTTSKKPDVCAPGSLIYSTYPGGGYAVKSGTSMAAPHAAAVAALLLSADPDMSNVALSNLLINSADDLGPLGWDTAYGFGAVNPSDGVKLIKESARVDVTIDGEHKEPVEFTLDGIPYRTDVDVNFYLPKGKSSIFMDCYGYTQLYREIDVKQPGVFGELTYNIEELPRETYKGYIKLDNGNPTKGYIQIANGKQVINTDDNGYFEAEVPQGKYEYVYWGLGGVPETVDRQDVRDADTTVELEIADVLVAATQFQTPSRYFSTRFDKFCYRAYDEIGLKYCPINPLSTSVKLDDLKMFDRVYWLVGPGELTTTHETMLENYLLEGGKLFLSASNLLYYDLYSRNTDPIFVETLFGVNSVQQEVYTTSLVGVTGSGIGDGLVLALSGGDGASNQIGFDAFAPNKNIAAKVTPFLHYLGPASYSNEKLGYGGATIESGNFAAVYLSFGLEVINNREDRKTLLNRIEEWFADFGRVDITFEDEGGNPVYTEMSIDGFMLPVKTGEDGHIKLSTLRAGKYNAKVKSLGFKEQEFSFEVAPNKSRRVRLSLADPMSIVVSGQVTDGMSGKPLQCDFYVKGVDTKKYSTDSDGRFDLTLPSFDYNVKFFSRRYKHEYISIPAEGLKDTTQNIKLYKYTEPFAVFENMHPTWARTGDGIHFFQGLGQTYDRIIQKAGFKPVKHIIYPGDEIPLEDLEQYDSIVWICGYNDQIAQDWWVDVVTEYILGGGKVAFIGHTIPAALQSNPELMRLLGFELESPNTRIYTVGGVKDDPIGDGFLFSLHHPYIRYSLIVESPSLRPVGDGVSCFNLVGGNSAGVWVDNGKQKTVIVAFDLVSIYEELDTLAVIFKRIADFIDN